MAITRTRQVRRRIKTQAVQSAVVIRKYDVVVVIGGEVYPANQDTNADNTGDIWSVDEATTQGIVKDDFLGIAMQESMAGDTRPIMVATDVECYADLTSAAYAAGSMVRLQKASGNNVVAQSFKAATNDTDALGRYVDAPGTVTAGWIQFLGRLPTGGVYPVTT